MNDISKKIITGIAIALLFITFVALIIIMPILWFKVASILYDFIPSFFGAEQGSLFEFWCQFVVCFASLVMIPFFALPIAPLVIARDNLKDKFEDL